MTLSYWTWDWRRMFPSFWFWRPVRCCSVICSAWRGHPSSRSWGDGWAFGNLFWNYLRKKNANLNYFWDTKGRKVWVVEVNISSRMVSQKWSYANKQNHNQTCKLSTVTKNLFLNSLDVTFFVTLHDATWQFFQPSDPPAHAFQPQT